jgi:hypothetical protein
MELFEYLERLAEKSRHSNAPKIDVVLRVSRSIRLRQDEEPALLDRPSLAFAGLSLAVTAIAAVMFSPLLTTLMDPWAAYMNAPWSY